jgi:hypothetical protein
LLFNPILEIFYWIFASGRTDDDKLANKMTSFDRPLSNLNLQQVATAFDVERQVLTPELSQLIEEKEKIAAGLLLCLSMIVGQTIAVAAAREPEVSSGVERDKTDGKPFEDVKIEQLDRIYPPGRNQGLIDFKLVCRLPTQAQVQLGICILPFTDAKIVSEACTKLLVYKDFGLDRLCLLRQSDLMTNVRQLPTCLPKLLSTDIGGNFIPLKSKDVLFLLTTLSVFQQKQQYGVTNELIFDYLTQTELLLRNELIKSILVSAQF